MWFITETEVAIADNFCEIILRVYAQYTKPPCPPAPAPSLPAIRLAVHTSAHLGGQPSIRLRRVNGCNTFPSPMTTSNPTTFPYVSITYSLRRVFLLWVSLGIPTPMASGLCIPFFIRLYMSFLGLCLSPCYLLLSTFICMFMCFLVALLLWPCYSSIVLSDNVLSQHGSQGSVR